MNKTRFRKAISVIKEYLSIIMQNDKSYLLLLLLYSIVTTIGVVIDTVILKYIIDMVMKKHDVKEIIFFATALLLTNLLMIVIATVTKRVIEIKNIRLVACFEKRLSEKIMSMKYEDIDNPDVLDMKDKAIFPVRNQNAIELFLKDMMMIMQSLFSIFALIILISSIDLVVLLVIFLLIIVDIYLFQKVQEAEYEFYEILIKDNRKLDYYRKLALDYKYGKDIRLFGFQELIEKRIGKYVRESTDSFADGNKKIGKWSSGSSSLLVFRMAIIYGYIAKKVYDGIIGIGSFTMYVNAVVKFSESINSILTSIAEIGQLIRYLNDYFEFEHMPSDPHINGEDIVDDTFEITFDHVYFKYPNQERDTLSDVNFTINNKEIVALVGMNGTGKTTIVKLLCGFYSPTKGRILINGKDIKKYNYEKYLDKLAVVFQDFKIFASPIDENICFDRLKETSNLEIIYDQLDLADFIKSAKKGDKTNIYKYFDSEGIELSGGIGQRIAIGRALTKQKGLLILDEPTAALDPVVESEVFEKMEKLSADRTTIFVSHRMTSCLIANRILVIKDGTVIASGNHKELIKDTDGEYYKLFNAQAKAYMA